MASKNRIGMQDADGYTTCGFSEDKTAQWEAWQKLTPEEKAQQSQALAQRACMQRILESKNRK